MNLSQLCAIAATSIFFPGTAALAQSRLEQQVEIVRQINSGKPLIDQAPLAAAGEPSAQIFTIPSLWWQQQRQGDAINPRLIDTWKAYDTSVSTVSHVDVMVNGQIWPLLSYLEQYAFITQFGESAKSYGYQLRIFTGNRLVGLYVCDFMMVELPANSAACVVEELDYFGQGAIRGGRRR